MSTTAETHHSRIFLSLWFSFKPFQPSVPAGNYMFKVNNRNTRTNVWNTFKVNNKASKTMPFIVKFEHISHLCSNVSIVNFEQVNAGWDYFTVMPFLLIMKKCITLLFTARIWASFTLAWNLQFVAFIS